MNPLLRFVLPLVLLGEPILAQDQATTLLTACEKADVIVRATVLAASDPSPDWHRLEFRSDEVLRGQVGATFALLEPAGQCCGRSLFALQNGNECLLFLQRRGATLHPWGGARGVLEAEPAVLLHVRDLLLANTPQQRTQVLTQTLQSDVPRLANDAAHSLASLPTLQLTAGQTDLVLEALGLAVARGSATSASLVDVALRAENAVVLDALIPMYLDQTRADRARLLRGALSRCSTQGLAERLPMHLRGLESRELRAIELVSELPAEDAQPLFQAVLSGTRNPRVQLYACEGLMANGTRTSSLQGRVPNAVLDLAERRRNQPKTFRNLRPEQR